MKPYYEDDHVTIYHGDCLHVLADLDVEIGQVLTSPPYNKGARVAAGTEWRRLADGYGSCTDDLPHAEYVEWQQAIVSKLWSMLADDGAIYYQHKPIAKGNAGLFPFELIPPYVPVRQVITWDRGSGFQRQHTHYVPRYEWILVCAREAFRINSLDVFDLWKIPPNVDPDHPASFPIELARLALRTTDAELILDPFMGSGTTLRAAKDLGRKAIGIEIEERYCEIAAKRMGQEVLFA
jgi:DNA modification methylase